MPLGTEHPRAFLSYARSDADEFARELRARIEREEPAITLWHDRARMEGGVGWWKQITEALEVVEYLILVMTPAAMRSDTCRREWRHARQQGVCVYPVKGVPDDQLDYGALPRWMRKAHFFDLEREWEVFVNGLKTPCRASRVPFMAPDLPAHFVARDAILDAVRSKLLDSGASESLALTTALRGAGGLGKTTAAAALCHHDDVIAAFDDGILWVTLGETPLLHQAVAKLYAALTGERPAFVDLEDAAYNLAERLQDLNCLIVVDDVWNPAHLKPFLRGGRGCTRLITTRFLDVAVGTDRFDVDAMTPSESVALLRGRLLPAQADSDALRRLASRLDHWPLLLDLAGAALASRVARGDEVERALAYLELKLEKQGVVAFDHRNATERHQAIANTLEVTLALLDSEERRRLVELSVFPEDTDVPLEVVASLWRMDEFATEELVQRLDNLSLLKFSLQRGEIELHDVVRGYLSIQVEDLRALHAKLVDGWGLPELPGHDYGWKWLAHHLDEAGRAEELRELLASLEWMHAKTSAVGISSLLDDYSFFPHDDALELLQRALSLSAHVIAGDPDQLHSQLLSRLPADDERLTDVRAACVRWHGSPWLRPLRPLLAAPGAALLSTIVGHEGRVRAVGFLPDGERIVSGSDDGTVRVWSIDRGTQVAELRGHSDWVRALALTPDGRYAISCSEDHTLRVWDLGTGDLFKTIDTQYEWLRIVALTPDGERLLVAADDAAVKVWDWRHGTLVGTLHGHLAKVNSIAALSDGRALTASDDRTLRLWELATCSELGVLRGHTARVQAVATIPGERECISAAADDTLRIWSLEPGKEGTSRVLSGEFRWVRAIAVTPDGRRAVTASEDRDLEVWDLERGAKVRTLTGHTDWVNTVAIAPNGRQAVSASDDRTLKIWDLDPERQATRAETERHTDRVRDLAFTADGARVVSAGGDRRLVVWDAQAGTIERSESGLDVHRIVPSPEGARLICSEGDGVVRVRALESLEELCVFRKHADRVRALALTPDGKRVLSVGDDKTLRIWGADAGTEELAVLLGTHVRSLVVTPDGGGVISGSVTGTIRMLSTETGAIVAALDGHSAKVSALRTTPDGCQVVSASDDHTVHVTPLVDGGGALVLVGHAGRVNALAVAADGRSLVTASDDCTVRTWSLPEGRALATFTGEHPFLACAVSPSGQLVVAGDRSGLVHFLQVE